MQLGRYRRRWKNNIKKSFKEIKFRSVEWIALVQDRKKWRAVADTVKNLRVP